MSCQPWKIIVHPNRVAIEAAARTAKYILIRATGREGDPFRLLELAQMLVPIFNHATMVDSDITVFIEPKEDGKSITLWVERVDAHKSA